MTSPARFYSLFPEYARLTILRSLLSVGVLLMLAFGALADTRPASPFTDHMVLQRNAPVPVWGTASPGEQVTVSFDAQQRRATAGADGKWMIRLGAMRAGGPFVMKITGQNTIRLQDIYVGEVWLCSGQSNMDMTVAREDRYWCGVYNERQEVAGADYPLIRVFDVDFVTSDEPVLRVNDSWEICSPATVGHFSAAAYFFARELYRKYKLPIGLITTAYGASTAEAWTSKKTLESDPLFAELLQNYEKRKAAYDTSITAIIKYKEAYAKWQIDSAAAKAAKKDPPREAKNPDPKRDQHSPYVLYNGMVAPLIPYAIRGAIWYQGESNTPTADIYDRLMAALIGNWRTDWGQGNFPFIYVQLANNGKRLDTIPGQGGGATRVREGQLKNLSVPNTAMVVAIDNADDPANIHPKNKQEIGRRLALDAEALAYGEKIPYSGPIYEKMKIEGNAIRISFAQADGGLVAKGNDSASLIIPGLPPHSGQLTGFAIAGADQHFVWADARIDGRTILVSNPAVPVPVAVRYGWGDNPLISLYNKAGLPASPFRTDNWSVSPVSFVQDSSSHFSSAEIMAVLQSGAGVSGAGCPVAGNGGGGWRSGTGGVLYAGDHPNPLWKPLPAAMFTGSVIKNGLLPSLRPCWDVHIRDAVICPGGDGNYYMTGSTGDNIWAYNDGVELWRSADMIDWQYMGLVWSIEKDGGWERQWRNLHDHPARALWAPELHYIKGNYFICLSMPPYGISILKSTTGRPEGPYIHATDPNKSFVRGIDPTLFEDEDGKVYFTYSGANRIVRMKDDLSDTAEAWHKILLADPDHDSTHHASRCVKRGMNDLGTEGAVLFKAHGKYYIGAADDYEGRYSTCLAISDNIYGPYRMRHESVPGGGGTGFFQDRQGNWYSSFFGNDDQSPWREKPGIVKVGFDPQGKVVVDAQQPFAFKGTARELVVSVSSASAPSKDSARLPVLETGAIRPMPDEWIDRDTHHKIIRLTRAAGNNAGFYFHNDPFIGDKMVFYNTYADNKQIYTVDLHTLQVAQITSQSSPMNGEIAARKSRSVFYQVKDSVFSTNIDSRETKLVYVFPADFRAGVSTLNTDETLLAGAQSGDEAKEIAKEFPEKSQYFNRIYDAHIPHTLFTIDIRTGELKKIHQENTWLGHVQFSPTDPSLLMFCHEGPWQKVDRIWTIDVRTGTLKLMHKRTVDNEIAGHEFFSPDGKTIWFDWQIPKGQTFFLGGADLNTGAEKKYQMTRDEWSIHFNISPDQQLFAGDGGDSGQVARAKDGRWIYLFRPEGDHFVSEKLVNMKYQYYKLEPNVHFSPDGRWIIFRANFEGREDVYAVQIENS